MRILLLAGMICCGQLLAQVPYDGLIAYYPFEGDASDASGNASFVDRLSDGKQKAADYALQDALVQGPGPDGDHQVLVTNRLERKHRTLIEGFDGTLVFERG